MGFIVLSFLNTYALVSHMCFLEYILMLGGLTLSFTLSYYFIKKTGRWR